jgi:hypothetical protein
MRKTHSGRGKSLGSGRHLGGKKVQQYGGAGKGLFEKKPKAVEADNVGRKMRPPAHNPRQTKVAKRARNTVKRLSDQVI